MDDLKSRVQKTRENFSATVEQYDRLKDKMLTGKQVRQKNYAIMNCNKISSFAKDPGVMNKMYTRQGYLYGQTAGKNSGVKKALAASGASGGWTKYYCQYVAKTKTLTLIPYSQLTGKITSTETLRVSECVCKEEAANVNNNGSGKTGSAAASASGGVVEKYKFIVTGDDLGESASSASAAASVRPSRLVCADRVSAP